MQTASAIDAGCEVTAGIKKYKPHVVIVVAFMVQVCKGALDSTGHRQGLCVLLLFGVGAAAPDEFQRRLLHSCPCERPGGVRSAAVCVLAGTAGSGGDAGGFERLSGFIETIYNDTAALILVFILHVGQRRPADI